MVFIVKAVDDGFGRHQYYVPTPQLIEATKWIELSRLVFIAATTMTKISICLFIIRIPNSKRVIYSLYAMLGCLILVNGAWMSIFVAQCRPFSRLWNFMSGGTCWSRDVEVVADWVQGGLCLHDLD